ncbi:MAG: hypothetical protein EOO75_17045, partial [Myxococcales bacterium]
MAAITPYTYAPRLPEGDALSLDAIVPGTTPIEIEIGPGRGGFLYERLVAQPDVRMLAFEVRRKWSQLVDERLQARGFGGRARVLAEDAREALTRLRPDGAVSTFFVHFPDPWWKKRHTKRLVVGDILLLEMARLLRPGGELYVQTDVEDRAVQYEEAVARVPAFVPAGDEPGLPRLAANPYGARSNREHRADADGLPVWRMRWRRALDSRDIPMSAPKSPAPATLADVEREHFVSRSAAQRAGLVGWSMVLIPLGLAALGLTPPAAALIRVDRWEHAAAMVALSAIMGVATLLWYRAPLPVYRVFEVTESLSMLTIYTVLVGRSGSAVSLFWLYYLAQAVVLGQVGHLVSLHGSVIVGLPA